MTRPLHLLHLPVDLRALARFAAERGRGQTTYRRHGRERDAGLDEGRALHHVLDETFGPAALRPFRVMPSAGGASGAIYAYSQLGEGELRQTARETAPPEVGAILGLERMQVRALPATWPVGRRLAFDVRVRPVVRIRGSLPNPREADKPYGAGAELDAWFVEAQRRFPDARPRLGEGASTTSGMQDAGRTREAVYRDWLAARLAPAAVLDAETVTLHRFARTRVARQGHAPEGPDATLLGELVVTDASAFQDLLSDGVGRHKSYGFGMLLLRPARRRGEEAF